MRELRVEDALIYLDQVKVEFGDRPHIYNEFLDIMKTFKTQQIDTPGVIRRVSNLFQGNRRLVLGFNTFLPEGYKIEIPKDGDGPPVAVYRAPGSDVAHILRESAESEAVSVKKAAAAATPPTQQANGTAPFEESNLLGANRLDVKQNAFDVFDAARLPTRNARLPQQTTSPPTGNGSPSTNNTAAAAAQRPKNRLPLDAGGVAPRQQQQQPRPVTEPRAPPQQLLPGGVAPRSNSNVAPRLNGSQQHTEGGFGTVAAVAAPPEQQPGQPLEFDHAINYVTTIKRRFASEPETYKKFLEILHTYQKEQRGIKEVLDEVSELFDDHPDLLKEFTFFLPDAVQAQAKVQLDHAAKEAEARKRLKAKAAIMSTAQGMARQAQTLQKVHSTGRAPTQEIQAAPSVSYPTPTRSTERENAIIRSAQYGVVKFTPVRPPRKHDLLTAAVAFKSQRPRTVPELPLFPNTSEAALLQRVKEHLNRKELAADKQTGSKKHTPYTEFLKTLHLFAAGVLTKEELVFLLKGLFQQGHAPKSGANASGGSQHPPIAQDAHELLCEFEDLLIGRGPYAKQQQMLKDNSKYGALRVRDFDFSGVSSVTPSYQHYPEEYPYSLFISNPGQSRFEAQVLNEKLVCVDLAVADEEGSSRKRKAPSIEDSDGSKKRHNMYEEMLFRVEDERYEMDMAIERNVHALRLIEPFAKEVQALREQEEKDGQPIGRLQYQLNRHSLNSIHINAIGRIYGDRGDEILQHLFRNPLIVLPIVYQRLKQKDAEFRKAKGDLVDEWNKICEANYEGSMDIQCYFNRRALEKSFATNRLLDHCKRARSFLRHPERIKSHEAADSFAPTFGKHVADPEARLFQPFVEISCIVNSAHEDAFQLVSHRIRVAADVSPFDRERIGRIWAEFMVPWFRYPTHWVLDEVRESFSGKLGPSFTKFASGQRVVTTLGEGIIASFSEADDDSGPMYRVKLPFGHGHLSPSAILYAVPSRENPLVRRDGVMVRNETPPMYTDETSKRLGRGHQLLFGTEKVYLFLRLYGLLCSVLADIREQLETLPPPNDPTDSYISTLGGTPKKNTEKLNFSTVVASLRKVMSIELNARQFESLGRRVSPQKVHEIAALPKLVERCADALLKVAEEDALLHLYDLCRYDDGVDPVAVQSQCLSVVPDAFFRIQLDRSSGSMRYCYLEAEPLLTAPPDDADNDVVDSTDDAMDEVLENGEEPHEAKLPRLDLL